MAFLRAPKRVRTAGENRPSPLAKLLNFDQLCSPAMADTDSLPQLPAEREEKLGRYLDLLLEANTRFNLTAIVDVAEARERHINECLRLVPLLDQLLSESAATGSADGRKRVLDLGSGGGLPGMVLAIARPEVDFVLLEATEKKARFLRETARELDLRHVDVACSRAEIAAAPAAPLRESFDVVCARAVAALPTLVELAAPFSKVKGHLMLVKGQRYAEELQAAERAFSLLHLERSNILRHPSATILLLHKTRSTPPRYPRRSGEPKKKPL